MDQNEAKSLLDKYNSGTCTEEEKAIVEAWFLTLKHEGTIPAEQKIEQASLKVWAAVEPPAIQIRRPNYWPRFAAAASILLVATVGLYFYRSTRSSVKAPQTVSQDVSPGKKGATLTLANGEKIRLSDAADGQLAKQSGVTITKSANGQLIYSISPLRGETAEGQSGENTLSTSVSETYRVRLPDKTEVWLNSASTIKYPASFAAMKNREVEITGEAYFQVAKNKEHPFIVKHKDQQLTVLGTHFNISAYPNETLRSTLEEGSVKISAGGQTKLITPGQQTVLNQGKLTVQEADMEETLAWKNEYFRFNDEDIRSIMTKLARWYNIEVVYQGKPTSEAFNAAISRNKNISQVLKMLERTQIIHFKIEGRRITVIE